MFSLWIDLAPGSGHPAPVKIFLMRHAAAVQPETGISDGHRFLTRAGRDSVRAVGRTLREAGVELDVIVTSPLVRAVQTAELLADSTDYLGEIASHAAFTPGVHPQVTIERLTVYPDARSVAIVGHEPCMSDLAAFIVGQPGFAPFRQAQVCLFEDRKPVWKLHPEALQFQDLFVP